VSTVDDALRELVRGVVRDELEALRAELVSPPSPYLDRQQTAQRLAISIATLDRLCRAGLPCVRVGDSRRFLSSDVDAWIRARGIDGGP
jgi:excisionase family DNA binding protein